MAIYGVDVSSYQAEHFPLTVHGHSISFAIIKATEGNSYVNEKMAGQVAWARSHNLHVGFYHFVRDGDMKAQAKRFVDKALSQEGDSLWEDWEDPAVSGAEKDQFLHEVKRLRPTHKAGLYCSRDYWVNHDHTSYAGDALWIANYTGTPGTTHIQADWVIHQYNNHDTSNGTKIKIDVNVADFSSKAAMVAWAKPAATKAPAKKPAAKAPAKPKYEPFPGASFFHAGRKSPIVAAMHKRLVAVGCNHYHSSAHPDVWGTGDVASYAAWQRKCGYTGHGADGKPGKSSWDKLHVPNV